MPTGGNIRNYLTQHEAVCLNAETEVTTHWTLSCCLFWTTVLIHIIIHLYMFCGYSRERQEDVYNVLTAEVVN